MEDLKQLVRHEFKSIKNWFEVNKLNLNFEKSFFMCFSSNQKYVMDFIDIDSNIL